MRVVIVGAGLVGTAVARALARQGAEVVVIERGVPGAEASWAAGGILSPQAECDSDGPMLRLCLDGLAATRRLANELKAELGGLGNVGLIEGGTLDVAVNDEEARALRHRVQWQQAAGLQATWLDPAGVKSVAGVIGDVAAGAFFPTEASLDPRLLFEALRGSATNAGARFVQHFVRRVTGQSVVVDHDGRDEVIAGDVVVVCAGAWTPQVAGTDIDADAIFPVHGQMVEVDGRAGAFDAVVYGRGGYVVPRGDGRVVAGSTMERQGFQKGVTVGGLAKVLSMVGALVPSLQTATVRSSWAGLRPGSRDGLPLLGQQSSGLWLASGHFRNGVLLAAISGERLAGALLRQEPIDDAFSPRRFSRPPS
jgi:glycine oxidase